MQADQSHTLIEEGTSVVVMTQHPLLGYIIAPGVVRFPVNQQLTEYHVDVMVLPEGHFKDNEPGPRLKPSVICVVAPLEDIKVVGGKVTQMISNDTTAEAYSMLIKAELDQIKPGDTLAFIHERVMTGLAIKANMIGLKIDVQSGDKLSRLAKVMLNISITKLRIDPVTAATNALGALSSILDNRKASEVTNEQRYEQAEGV